MDKSGGRRHVAVHAPRSLLRPGRNAYVDERFDPEKSTRAYARYMKFIYNQLGDWYLSMAAYDWGTGNIQHAVQKTGYADFWELYKRNNLPGETKNYVPEILAAIIIANNPTQYGFDDVTLDPPVLTDTVTINYSVDLRLVSDIVDAPIDELMALNPSLLRMVTPPDASFDLHLPAGTATLFEQRIASCARGQAQRVALPSRRRGRHAGLGRASVPRLRVGAGRCQSTARYRQHARRRSAGDPAAPVAAPSSRMLLYTARKGDTLVTIADRFGVSLTELRRWNNMTGVKVEPGRRLHVPSRRGHRTHRAAIVMEPQSRQRKSSACIANPAAQRVPRTKKHRPLQRQHSKAQKSHPAAEARRVRRRAKSATSAFEKFRQIGCAARREEKASASKQTAKKSSS
jgi:membrane-bound lytic murein transglycosylase D